MRSSVFARVSEESEHVRVVSGAVDAYVAGFAPVERVHWTKACPFLYKRREQNEDEVDFLFLLGSQAFCFWGYPEKWRVKYKGQTLDGWWAMVASMQRAYEKDARILEGQFLADLQYNDVKELFAGEPDIPLLRERWYILKWIGEQLVESFEGRFHVFWAQAGNDASSQVRIMSELFAGFDDVFVYKGVEVPFYKKAQVVVSDIYEVFEGKGFGALNNLDTLTGHADYKIPMILRRLEILEYSDELAELVDNRKEIAQGSKMEVEIRANTLYALKLLSRKLKPDYSAVNPTVLSGMLWVQSQTKQPDDKPYHLTETVYY